MRAFVIVMILFMLLNPAYNVSIKPVNTDPYFKWTLDLYEDIAVWHEIKEYEGGEVKKSDIVIHNLSTGKEEVIDRPGIKVRPTIYGNNVVYYEETNDKRSNLWLYNIKTKEEKMIKSSISSNMINIYEDKLVYDIYNSTSGKYQVYLYNITTEEENLIASDKNADCLNSCIYRDRIAYIKGNITITGAIKDPKLILYDLNTRKGKIIAQAPAISWPFMHTEILVWIEDSEDYKDGVMYYNITTGEKKRLPVDWPVFVDISVYNNTIVFTGGINDTCGGIAGYDLSTDTYFPISITNITLMMYPHIYENRVVWIDWRDSPRPAVLTLIQPNQIWMAEIRR